MSDWEGVDAFFGALDRLEAAADRATKELVATASAKLVKRSQANFVGSHRRGEPHVGGPKPNIVTGQTRRSIRPDPITRYGRASYGTIVAPRVKWGRRLELGFKGSRGYPYFGPAARELEPEFRRDAADIWRKNMSSA